MEELKTKLEESWKKHKVWWIVGGAVVLGGLAYLFYRMRSSSSSSSAGSSSGTTYPASALGATTTGAAPASSTGATLPPVPTTSGTSSATAALRRRVATLTKQLSGAQAAESAQLSALQQQIGQLQTDATGQLQTAQQLGISTGGSPTNGQALAQHAQQLQAEASSIQAAVTHLGGGAYQTPFGQAIMPTNLGANASPQAAIETAINQQQPVPAGYPYKTYADAQTAINQFTAANPGKALPGNLFQLRAMGYGGSGATAPGSGATRTAQGQIASALQRAQASGQPQLVAALQREQAQIGGGS